jgi:hypothetical protein
MGIKGAHFQLHENEGGDVRVLPFSKLEYAVVRAYSDQEMGIAEPLHISDPNGFIIMDSQSLQSMFLDMKTEVGIGPIADDIVDTFTGLLSSRPTEPQRDMMKKIIRKEFNTYFREYVQGILRINNDNGRNERDKQRTSAHVSRDIPDWG